MRVCLQKSTGRLLEMQSAAAAGTLLANAAVAFPEIPASDIEEREVTVAEYKAIADAQPGRVFTVSRLRFKLELADRGLLSTVEAAVNAAGTLPKLYWDEATDFESNHPLVAQIGAAIGLTEQQIAAMFKSASEREA